MLNMIFNTHLKIKKKDNKEKESKKKRNYKL